MLLESNLKSAFVRLKSTPQGLSGTDASSRLTASRSIASLQSRDSDLRLLLRQFKSPLVLLLLVAMSISATLGDRLDALIVFGVIAMSTLMGFWQERRSAHALAALLKVIQTHSTVLRDGIPVEVPSDQIVYGDVIVLNAGDAIPGDGLILEAKDLFVDESVLTGESYPAEKEACKDTEENATEAVKSNFVYEGTHVISGIARVIIARTGSATELGKISEHLQAKMPETNFETGMRRFGEMLMQLTLVLVISIFAINTFFQRPVLESFTFALALAVGITPELFPAIVSITLASGAQRLAQQHVIVRRLSSIENLGSMTVLCSDKTGTLTEGAVRLHASVDSQNQPSPKVALYAAINATCQTGFTNPIDETLRNLGEDVSGFLKIDEVPYDFTRKRLSVVVSDSDLREWMITKGAFANVIAVCNSVETINGVVAMGDIRAALQDSFIRYSNEGYRVLGIATKEVTGDPLITKDDESDLTFLGFLLFEDPAKLDAADAIQNLKNLSVGFKVITGDNRFVARRLGIQMGLKTPTLLAGEELHKLSDDALARRVSSIDIFAETEPTQKERILLALRRCGHVVGYLGDGINDASALHAADVGISVDTAVDVAKEAADLVLLKHDLNVIADGVRTGRNTFANSMKYIFITTSANFGNMFSMAGASLFMPFLPLLPKQILLNNFLSDLPALTIATDAVDPEQVLSPRQWDNKTIRRFMVTFGLVSSLFDILTFIALLVFLKASEAQFQTGWFIESLLTELLIILVIRTRRSVFRSRPSRLLALAIIAVTAIAILVPYTAVGAYFALTPLPWWWLATLIGISSTYIATSELLKTILFPPLFARRGSHGYTDN